MNAEKKISVHPGTWWLFGIAISIAASLSTSLWWLFSLAVLSLTLIAGAKEYRQPSSASFKLYFFIAAAVVISRLAFRIIFNPSPEFDDIWLALPTLSVHLGFGEPVSILGSISLASFQSALKEGVRLACIILGIGVAATLANPRQLLRSSPAAIYEIAISISMAVNLVPQLVKSSQRVKQASKIRGRSKKTGLLVGTLIPVLEDAIESSMLLSASMSARGFGKKQPIKIRLVTGLLSLISLALIAIGLYLFINLGFKHFSWIALGAVLALVSVAISSATSTRTRFLKKSLNAADVLLFFVAAALVVISSSEV